MIQDFTLDEIVWRFEMQNDLIETNLHEIQKDSLSEDEDSNLFHGFIGASLIYLQHKGCITVTLHNCEETEGAFFTATRLQCEQTSWPEIDPESAIAYERPSGRDIPIPVLFNEEGNEKYSHISLSFKFPNTNLGNFCKKVITYLRECCKTDVDVVNAVVFMQKYFTTDKAYGRSLKRVIPFAFVENFWELKNQTPSEVEELMGMVLEDESFNLYDPFMRTGTNFVFAFENKKYCAQATDKQHLYATMFFAGLYDIETENIKLDDCITNWAPQDCDTIIATPELSMEVTTGDEVEPISTWTLEKVFQSMTKEGRRGLMLLPASILISSGKAKRLRHDITESNLLDTIMLLPAKLFSNTNAAVAIILLKSGRAEDAPITLCDFSTLYSESDDFEEFQRLLDIDRINEVLENKDPNVLRSLSVADFREADYEWFVPKFIHKQTDVPVGHGRFKIKDLIQINPLSNNEWGWRTLLLTKEAMTYSPFEDYPMLNIVPDEDEEDLDITHGSLSRSCLIIDFHEGLKTFYHEGEPNEPFLKFRVAVPNEFHCFHINPDMLHIGYLRLILSETYNMVAGSINSNSSDDIVSSFMNTEVTIPLAIEEQKQIYEQRKLNAALEKARKEGLDEAINAMKQEYMMEVRMRKHDMKPFLSQLDSQAKLIAFYMDKIEGNEEIVSAIRQKLTGISNVVSELRLHLNRLTEEDIYGNPELINPLDVLKELTGNFTNYSVDLDVDQIALSEAGIESPEIYISRVDLSTLSTTIIENAVVHAFTGVGHDYRVHISFTFDKEKNIYIIDFTNNGTPMPLGMDKFRYGLKGEKGAKSKGSGLGGYRVKSITKHFGGDYDVFCHKGNGLTTIRVTFPKDYKYEQI